MLTGFILFKYEMLEQSNRLMGFYGSEDAVNEAIYREYEEHFDYLHDFDITAIIDPSDKPKSSQWGPMSFNVVSSIDGCTAAFEFKKYPRISFLIFLVAGLQE